MHAHFKCMHDKVWNNGTWYKLYFVTVIPCGRRKTESIINMEVQRETEWYEVSWCWINNVYYLLDWT